MFFYFSNCFFFYRDICSFIDKLDVIFSGRVVIMSRFQLHSCNSFSTFCCWAAADFTTKQERATDSNNLLINKMSGRKKTNGLKMCKIKNLIKFFFSFDEKYILFDFWCTMNEIMVPKLVDWILDEFNECNQQTPWMWTIDNQTLQ